MKLLRSLVLCSWLTTGQSAESHRREEFMARMDAAVAEKKRDARVTSKLMQLAKPLEEEQPRFLEEYQDFAINITEYALRYIGCQNVHQWSDEMAADESSGTVLGMNRFVIVRLCPKDECSNYNHYGCNAGFGDYLIPMEDYLQTMAEEYFLEYQNYCETCYYCMVAASSSQQQQQQQQQQQNGDDAAAAGDDAAGDDAAGDDGNNGGRRRLAYSSYNADSSSSNYNSAATDDYYYMNADFYNNGNDDGANNNNAGDIDCSNYYDACNDFRTACKDYSQYATDMEEYFECGQFQVGNNVGYLGPHCRSDGKTIGIGLYKDQYCNEYNSDMTDLSSIMGMDLEDINLKTYYSNKCISCLASDGYDLDQNDGQQVTSICGALYDMSAKCNKYMGYNEDYASYNQEDTSDEVCTFIHNLITNSYDEYGYIYLDNDSWTSYVPNVREMTKAQKYVLSFSLLAAVFLLIYACYLHRKISKAKYSWYPKGRRAYGQPGVPGQPVVMERMHSGIIQGRSRSGGPDFKDGTVYA